MSEEESAVEQEMDESTSQAVDAEEEELEAENDGENEEKESIVNGDDVEKTEDKQGSDEADADQQNEGEEEGEEGENEDDGKGSMSPIMEEVEILKKELSDIKPKMEPSQYASFPETFDPNDFPITYRENTSKELLVGSYAQNFRRQYIHLYKDRRPLFLCPLNECGVEKFVCTTLRPTKLQHRELYNWDGCAEFVADYLNFVPLPSSTELPNNLYSPATTLRLQRGTCFEYSTLLCSMLIGVGYDAYVVSGYATRETCFMDETRSECPLLVVKEDKKPPPEKPPQKKYAIKPSKDLNSKFLQEMANRKEKEEEEEAKRLIQEAYERELESYKPPPDVHQGMRVHAWVLVLSGKREVPESFFIEPLTGLSHPVNSSNYTGIESLWNHKNYWVNMQMGSDWDRLSFDLGDCGMWEYMFPSNDKPILTIPEGDNYEEEDDEEEIERDQKAERHLELPASWTEPIVLSRNNFEMRCPQGKKVKFYKKAKLEKFAPYLKRDGLITKLSVYADRELEDLLDIREYFTNRADHLEKRVTNSKTGWIVEHFTRGRHDQLKEHTYQQAASGPEAERTFVFYNNARADGLGKREEGPDKLIDHYIDRRDFLYYRAAHFGKRVKKFRPAGEQSMDHRPIEKIVIRYHHNPSLPATDDIEELVFLINEDRINITYHRDNRNVASNTREFIKPSMSDDKTNVIIMNSDTHSVFQVNPNLKDKLQVEIYQLLVDLINREEKEKTNVRTAEFESRSILENRSNEEVAPVLDIDLFDTLRNVKAKEKRRELEERIEEEKKRRQEQELDYLAPFLAQMGIFGDKEDDSTTVKLEKQQAFKLREECLKDFKQRLVDKANLIQARFERETSQLQKKQQWYQQNQISMSKDDEQEYLQYCHEADFRITTLEMMLSRHKEKAPHRYLALEKKIREDPRLAPFLN